MSCGAKRQVNRVRAAIGGMTVLGLTVLVPLASTRAAAPPREGVVAYVIDGDTVRLASGERIRIAGIDAPETRADNAKCKAEIALGKQASAQARALLEGRRVTVIRVGRSYDRTVAHLKIGGRDAAKALVASGAARWWPRGAERPRWCPTRDR
ncbi:thermonuclease family protein [Sphingomonas koreensis]|uniref:thermonuclease family protein n=1 Tax=Sphingomonas koreensis TaxID=93064 RepID=UPI000B30C920|nr:thermonuclease family protein [Sphingomonas koreensis]PJI87174.1 endonuclease YncB(thermonuclease family) [Sphingomonas koreensis]RSU59610.1 thermonuclease family protein [Sphingomonas koreensis]RSU68764.1 thermonuclease family protein [Sphingomonas koreensis]